MKSPAVILTFVLVCAFTVSTHSYIVSSSTTHAAQGEQASGATGIESLRQGRRLLKQGKADQALPLLESALQIFNTANAVRGQAATHDALGDLYSRQGQHRTALTHYQRAQELFQQATTKAAIVKRVTGIGDEEFNANLMLAKIGEAHYRAGSVAESGMAYSQMQVKKPDTSALGAAKKTGSFLGGLGRLGRDITSGDGPSVSTGIGVAGAVNSVQQTFELYRQSILYATYELGLGRVAYHNSSLEVAKKHFTNTVSATAGNIPLIGKIGQMRRFRVAANTSLGDVALKQGNVKDALKFYTDAAKGAQADKRLDLMWPAQRGIGKANLTLAAQQTDAQKKSKALQEAFVAYRAALQTIENIRQGSLRADEARTTFLATTRDVFDEASGALAAAALAAANKSAPLEGNALTYAAEAFRIVEQGRARSLLDMLGETGTTISEGIPAELLQRKRENLERQQEIAQQITGVSLTGEPPKEGVDKLEEELETLAVEYDSLENRIRTSSPRYGALTSAQPLTLAEVQQKVLDGDTALLEYSLAREQSYLWTVTNSSVMLYELPARDKLDALAMSLRDKIVPQSLRRALLDAGSETRGLTEKRGLALAGNASAAGVAAFAEASHALYQNTIAPAAANISNKRLLVVADGALNYVPFESLVTSPAAAGSDYAALPYLVKTNEVVYAPSASVVAAIRQQVASGANANARGLLVVADPIFDASDPRAKSAQGGAAQAGEMLAVNSAVADVTGAASAAGGGGNFKLARLSGTRLEAQQIKTLANASGLSPDIWLDLDASENRVKTNDVSKYRFLHVATHGLLNTERPQFTGVVLSLVGNREGDGFLRTDEIFNLRLGSPLVMLSACETGLGRERRGEGVIGLTRAFMYAGAPTVGVSLWSVSDSSTAELMTDFYKRLLSKQSPATPPAAAMRASQLSMIAGKKYSAPFYWAPFVLVGDWR